MASMKGMYCIHLLSSRGTLVWVDEAEKDVLLSTGQGELHDPNQPLRPQPKVKSEEKQESESESVEEKVEEEEADKVTDEEVPEEVQREVLDELSDEDLREFYEATTGKNLSGRYFKNRERQIEKILSHKE